MSDAARARPARADEYHHYVRLLAELGLDESPPPEDVWHRSFRPRTLFIDDGDLPVAYAFYDVMRACGYVRNLAVAGSHRRRGLGRAMMLQLAGVLRELGCTEWRLNVMVTNRAAIALYESCGFQRAYRTLSMRLPLAALDRMPASSSDLRVAPVPPERDAAIEADFDLAAGLLTSLRTRESDHILQLLDDSRSPPACIGVARFSPLYPGAFPFKVRDFAMVQAMVAAMRELTPPHRDAIMLTCEGDPGMVEFLRGYGATTYMDVFHMLGPLPAASA